MSSYLKLIQNKYKINYCNIKKDYNLKIEIEDYIKNLINKKNKNKINWFHCIILKLIKKISFLNLKENFLSIDLNNLFKSLNLFDYRYTNLLVKITNYYNINWILIILLLYNQSIIPILITSLDVETTYIKIYKNNLNFLIKYFKKNKIDSFYIQILRNHFNPYFRNAYLSNRIECKNILKLFYKLNIILDPKLNNRHIILKNINFENKKNIGFLSAYYVNINHPVFRDRFGIIINLDKNLFNIYCFVFYDINLIIKNLSNYININLISHIKFIKISGYNNETIEKIKKFKLQIMIFPDLNMNLSTYYLAYHKFANIQINTIGHSCTSGINTIDYYISSNYYNDKQIHYTEKLINLNCLNTYYYSPFKFLNFKNNNLLNKNNNIKILLCLNILLKINYEFTNLLIKLLIAIKNFSCILYITLDDNNNNLVVNNFKNKLLELKLFNKIKIIARQNLYNYFNYLNNAYLVLEPFFFGNFNSSFDVFWLNKPIVCYHSGILSGNFTSGLYKKMNIMNMISYSSIEYINICIKLVNDKNFYKNIINKIKKNKNLIFKEQDSINNWNQLLNKQIINNSWATNFKKQDSINNRI